MAQKKKVVWNQELEEFVEEKAPNRYGFCNLCGGINRNPIKVGMIWICAECRRNRLEDALKMSEDFEEKVRHSSIVGHFD